MAARERSLQAVGKATMVRLSELNLVRNIADLHSSDPDEALMSPSLSQCMVKSVLADSKACS
jgi:hypothetical protein